MLLALGSTLKEYFEDPSRFSGPSTRDHVLDRKEIVLFLK